MQHLSAGRSHDPLTVRERFLVVVAVAAANQPPVGRLNRCPGPIRILGPSGEPNLSPFASCGRFAGRPLSGCQLQLASGRPALEFRTDRMICISRRKLSTPAGPSGGQI